jgi:Ca2+-binding EF-hand superfamily protein
MKTLKILLTLGLPFSLAAAALAQPSDAPHGPRPGHRPPPPLLRALDADQDGEISAGEIAAAPSSLRVLDSNADGTISAAELHPPRPADAPMPPDAANHPARADRPHPVDPILRALDTDGNGELSPAEIANAAISLRTLDANGDGKLTRDELRPAGAPPRDGPASPHND